MVRSLSLAILVCLPHLAFAWGEIGHRVIGDIAQRHLCPEATRAADDLLNGESLSEASTWADDVRSQPEYNGLKPWHYVSMPLNSNYKDAVKSRRGDVVSAIHAQLAHLNEPLYPNRAEALRLVIHFVGDAHQPFHAGQHSDGGANSVDLQWFGRPTNLHSVWDSGMLRKLNLNFTELADILDSPAKPVVPQLSPEDWINQSSAIAATSYPSQTELGYAYHDQHILVVKARLREAGLRLAVILNTTFGCLPSSLGTH